MMTSVIPGGGASNSELKNSRSFAVDVRTIEVERRMEGWYQIVVALAEFLGGSKSLSGLREDLARFIWNVSASTSDRDRELVGHIELCLAEFEAGHLTFDELKAELTPITQSVFFLDPAAEQVKTGSAVEMVRHQQWLLPEGTQPSAGLASTTRLPV